MVTKAKPETDETETTVVVVEEEVQKRKRRTWSEDQKKQVVREALDAGPGKGSAIAIRNGIAPNLLYRWIEAYKDDVETSRQAVETPCVNHSDVLDKLKAENQKLRAMLAEYLLREKLAL